MPRWLMAPARLPGGVTLHGAAAWLDRAVGRLAAVTAGLIAPAVPGASQYDWCQNKKE